MFRTTDAVNTSLLTEGHRHEVWSATLEARNQTARRADPPDEIPQTGHDGLHRYLSPIALSVVGPTVFSAYVFAFWSLAADIGLTHSFPWSAGPLSSWFIWLALALLLTLVESTLPWNKLTEE